MIMYRCPHCENELRIDEKYAGQKGTCKHCRSAIVVPGRATIHTVGASDQAKLRTLFGVLAVFFPPAAIICAYTLPRTHPRRKVGLIAPSAWLVFALIVNVFYEQDESANSLPDARVIEYGSQPTNALSQSSVQLESRPETQIVTSGVVCDRFNVIGETVSFHLDTDLPDDTEVSVLVSRLYFEEGNASAYGGDYFNEKRTVGEWLNPRTVSVADEIFLGSLQQLMDNMAGIGVPFQVAKIQDEIEISFVVPVSQSNPAFGARNENICGLMVPQTGLKAVRGKKVLLRPLRQANSRTPVARQAFAMDLEIGQVYRLSRKTPLMPRFIGEIGSLENFSDAVARMTNLPPSTSIIIDAIRRNGETPWYFVRASGPTGEYLGRDWINSGALLGHEIWIR